MAIVFSLPSNEDTEARYELLNRLLLELVELLQTFMISRNPNEESPACRARPVSDSALPRIPDLLIRDERRRRICSVQTPPSSSNPRRLSRTMSDAFDSDRIRPERPLDYFGDDDDEVFCAPAATRPISTPRPRRRRRKSSLRETKRKRSTSKEDSTNPNTNDQADIQSPIVLKKDGEGGSLMSTLLSTSLGGKLWTAVVIVLGWKLLTRTKR